MNTEEFLTPKGKQYARYVYLAVRASNHLARFSVVKYFHGFVGGICFQIILQEGKKEDDRRKKAKMSKLRNGTGSSGGKDSGQVSES